MMGSVDLVDSVSDEWRGCAIAEALRSSQYMRVPRAYLYRAMHSPWDGFT
mgnify:CR=1 FL=1